MPTALAQVDREKIYQWINELSSPETRENALLELSKKRESVPDLAPMLWHSFGTIAALLQVGQAVVSLFCGAASAHCRTCASMKWTWVGTGGIPLPGGMIFVRSCGEGSILFECTPVTPCQIDSEPALPLPGQHGGCHVTWKCCLVKADCYQLSLQFLARQVLCCSFLIFSPLTFHTLLIFRKL